VTSLRERTGLNANIHTRHAGRERRRARLNRAAADERRSRGISAASDPATQKRMLRAKETGAWLTSMPDCLNGTELSADEFRDSLRLRFGLVPLGLPERYDGCGQRLSLGHAMSCKKGGLVLLRHNNVAAEWHHLCAQALTPSAVSDEPLIHRGWDGNGRTNAEGAEEPPELRGATSLSTGSEGGARQQSLTSESLIPMRPATETRILTRSWHDTRRRRRISTSSPAWPGDAPSLPLYSRLTACEEPKRARHRRSSPRASRQSGSGRTRKCAGSSAPASRSR
jgi:hypothetical protein